MFRPLVVISNKMNYNVTLIFFLFQVQILFSQRIPSYYKDIAPIINSNCVECHQNGGLGPFPLTNYEEVRSKIKMIINAIKIPLSSLRIASLIFIKSLFLLNMLFKYIKYDL